MKENSFTLTDPIGVTIHVYEWLPESDVPVRGIVQISHGMCETAARYARFAEALTGLVMQYMPMTTGDMVEPLVKSICLVMLGRTDFIGCGAIFCR